MVQAGRLGRSWWMAFLPVLLLAGCGGSNDGTFVGRDTVAIRGVVEDGTSPIANASCRAIGLDGRTLHTANADANGAFVLLVNPDVDGFIACAPANQSALQLRAFFTSQGQPLGGELPGQIILPETTVIARLVAQEFSDDPGIDPLARQAALREAVATDPDLQLLTEAATLLFNGVRGGDNADFEALYMDLVDDSVLDAPAFESRAEAINEALAERETELGRTLEQAYLAHFPPFNLSVLHHSGAVGALIDAGAERAEFGGIARFATVVEDTRFASRTFGSNILVSAGDQIGPGRVLQPSLDRQGRFFDGEAMSRLGYAALGLGPRDLALGPVVLADFLSVFSPPVPLLTSTLDVTGEQNVLAPILNERLPPIRIVEVGGRRIGLVSATRPDLARVSSPRRLSVAPADELVEVVQTQVDALRTGGARIVILLSQQADLDAERALAAALEHVDIMVAAGGGSLLAGPEDLLVPGDESLVAGVYPQWATDAAGREVPLVSTAGRYRYLGRLDVRLDPLGRLLDIDELNSGPIRVADASLADGVMPDAELQAELIDPLLEAIEDLATQEAADVEVQLNATAASLTSVETNFGNLLADTVLALARSQAQAFGTVNPGVAVVPAESVIADAMIPTGSLSRADVFDLVDPDVLITLVPTVTAAALKRLLEFALADGGGPEFLQLGGLRLEWDPAGTAQVLDEEGEVVTPGTRVRELRLSGGGVLVEAGEVRENASAVAIATTDRTARRVLGQPAFGGTSVNLGLSLPQALDRYLIEALQRRVRANDFPEGGSERITRLGD